MCSLISIIGISSVSGNNAPGDQTFIWVECGHQIDDAFVLCTDVRLSHLTIRKLGDDSTSGPIAGLYSLDLLILVPHERAYFKEQSRRVRAIADNAAPLTKKRLLALAASYDARIGRPSS